GCPPRRCVVAQRASAAPVVLSPYSLLPTPYPLLAQDLGAGGHYDYGQAWAGGVDWLACELASCAVLAADLPAWVDDADEAEQAAQCDEDCRDAYSDVECMDRCRLNCARDFRAGASCCDF